MPRFTSTKDRRMYTPIFQHEIYAPRIGIVLLGRDSQRGRVERLQSENLAYRYMKVAL